MIPETWQNETIELYRAHQFPTEWELDRVLMSNVRSVDTTIIQAYEGWWMLTTLGILGALPHDELHLFRQTTPTRTGLFTSLWLRNEDQLH
jgi:hypothetical protein